MKFLDGDPDPTEKDALESSVEREKDIWEESEEWPSDEIAVPEPVRLEDEQEVEVSNGKQKYESMLGTFLNVQLSLIGGFWIGIVPTAMISTGAAVGGWNGGIVSTALLAASAQIFLMSHPTFPIRVMPRSYGWEITNRTTGRKSYLQLLTPSEADRIILDRHLEDARKQRDERLANSLETAAKKAEKRRLKKAAKQQKKNRQIDASRRLSR